MQPPSQKKILNKKKAYEQPLREEEIGHIVKHEPTNFHYFKLNQSAISKGWSNDKFGWIFQRIGGARYIGGYENRACDISSLWKL